MDGCSPGGVRSAYSMGLPSPLSKRLKGGSTRRSNVSFRSSPLSFIYKQQSHEFRIRCGSSHNDHYHHCYSHRDDLSSSRPSRSLLIDSDAAHGQWFSLFYAAAGVAVDNDDDVSNPYLHVFQHNCRRRRPTMIYALLAAAFLLAALFGPSIAYGSNVPKFFTHLKTMQKSVCDGDMLHIKCPRNTSITFNMVFYGRNASYSRTCPGGASQGSSGGGRGSQNPADETTCIWKGALPLLVEACKNQQECKVNPHKEFRQRDPCPHIKKVTDVTYQCRPNLFLYKTVCQGEKMLLKCQGKQRRLLVFSAFFGATKLGVPECHQRDDIAKECNAIGATDAMIAECQGRRRCQLSASHERFGRILCAKQAAVFLRVVYTCVSRDILKEYDNDDEDFATDDFIMSSSSSSSPSTSLMSISENFLSTSPPYPSNQFTTDRPRTPFNKYTEGGNHGSNSGRGNGSGYRHGPLQVSTGGMGLQEREPLGGTPPSIIYNVPKPGSAGDTVRLHEVIDGSSANNGGQLRSSMSSSTVRSGSVAGGGLSDSSSGSSGNSSSGGLPGLLDLLWRNIGGAPRQQVMVFVGGGVICVCLVVSMACLIGSISRSRGRTKQQRKKLVVLTPDTCEFDTMGESSDSLSMGHIAPPTLTSTLHRASQEISRKRKRLPHKAPFHGGATNNGRLDIPLLVQSSKMRFLVQDKGTETKQTKIWYSRRTRYAYNFSR
ncbi:uncharacterized protein LOC111247626 isoform X1 [Varroa destructor]|uniref:SUEL-type lectin domain-containing protein n=1 Tax=Varroa destructor TaxID=109461 RepID=A0A7M7JQ32_VARDE|nr:uncharacterized protein LOC111247626 isoform X1 [Varroa destructor]